MYLEEIVVPLPTLILTPRYADPTLKEVPGVITIHLLSVLPENSPCIPKQIQMYCFVPLVFTHQHGISPGAEHSLI